MRDLIKAYKLTPRVKYFCPVCRVMHEAHKFGFIRKSLVRISLYILLKKGFNGDEAIEKITYELEKG